MVMTNQNRLETTVDESMIINDPKPQLSDEPMAPNDPYWISPSPFDNLDDEIDSMITRGLSKGADAISVQVHCFRYSRPKADRPSATTMWNMGLPIEHTIVTDEEARSLRNLIGRRMKHQPDIDDLRILHEGRTIRVDWHDDIAVLGIGYGQPDAIESAKLSFDGRKPFGRPTRVEVDRIMARQQRALRNGGITQVPYEFAEPVVKPEGEDHRYDGWAVVEDRDRLLSRILRRFGLAR
jgi:hypothetical protein